MRKFSVLPLALGLLVSVLSFVPAARAADASTFEDKPLDGVVIEALETYRNPKVNTFSFGLGYWPTSPYVNGFSLDLGYTHYFNKTVAWNVLRGSYLYTVDKGLTSELAERYAVNPREIERLQILVGSELEYVLAYGKFVSFKEFIRYFRASVSAGPALAVTNKKSGFGFDFGGGFESYVNDVFSWKFEIRDLIGASGDVSNNISFHLGTVYAF